MAMLVGAHEVMVLEPVRVTFIKHAWDFYRPIGWHNNDALMDMVTATAQYEEVLLWCQQQYSAKLGINDLLQEFHHVLFHNNAPYHAKRNLRLMCDSMYGKLSREQHEELYLRHVAQGVGISAQNATTYTCPLYASLISLVATVRVELIGRRLLCFSYGSGCAASIYAVHVQQLPQYPVDVLEQLTSRVVKSVDETLELVQTFENRHRSFPFDPTHHEDRVPGVYYLEGVNEMGVRAYTQHSRGSAVSVSELAAGVVQIKVQGLMGSRVMVDVLTSMSEDAVHVLVLDGIGASGLHKHGELAQQLQRRCDGPLIVVCRGVSCETQRRFAELDVVFATEGTESEWVDLVGSVVPGASQLHGLSRQRCATISSILPNTTVSTGRAHAASMTAEPQQGLKLLWPELGVTQLNMLQAPPQLGVQTTPLDQPPELCAVLLYSDLTRMPATSSMHDCIWIQRLPVVSVMMLTEANNDAGLTLACDWRICTWDATLALAPQTLLSEDAETRVGAEQMGALGLVHALAVDMDSAHGAAGTGHATGTATGTTAHAPADALTTILRSYSTCEPPPPGCLPNATGGTPWCLE